MEKLLTFVNYEEEKILVFYDEEHETFYIYNESKLELVHKYRDLKNAFYYVMEYIDTNINESLKMDIEKSQKEVFLSTLAMSDLYERHPMLFKALINN